MSDDLHDQAVVVPSLDDQVRESLVRRGELSIQCEHDPEAQELQLAICARDPLHFFDSWLITYDPRLVTRDLPAYVPFDLFPRQQDLVRWLEARVQAGEEGLVEKSRGMGWTYIAAGYALNKWLFHEGFLTSFGSRVEDLVDKKGDTKSIFEKIRILLYRLPKWMMPTGFSRTVHDTHMKLFNPENLNTITGEGGDNMGRGGRSSLYILDEAAFIPRAEGVAAAISDNADARIWASTPNGPGNVFARKRHDGGLRPDQVFTFHYRDDPRRDAAWSAKRKAELAATPWLYASEYDIDYNASVEGICIPGAWVAAAEELGHMLNLDPSRYKGIAGLDVGDGVARSVFQLRYGPLVVPPRSWLRPDTTATAYNALNYCRDHSVEILNFDEVGVGKGVLSAMVHRPSVAEGAVPSRLVVSGINVGRPASWQTMWPDGQSSRQKFFNLKAELWGIMRERFHASWEHLRFLRGEENGIEHDLDNLLVFVPSSPIAEEGYRDPYRELIVQLGTPKHFPNNQGKIIMESKPQLATRGVASPDFAEALALTFVPPITATHQAQAPVVTHREGKFPELSGGHVAAYAVGGMEQAVQGIGRFESDFQRDW